MITKSTTISAPDIRVRVGLRFVMAAIGVLAIIAVVWLVADRYLDAPVVGEAEVPVVGGSAVDRFEDFGLRHPWQPSASRWADSEDYALRHIGEPYAAGPQVTGSVSGDRLVDYALRHIDD